MPKFLDRLTIGVNCNAPGFVPKIGYFASLSIAIFPPARHYIHLWAHVTPEHLASMKKHQLLSRYWSRSYSWRSRCLPRSLLNVSPSLLYLESLFLVSFRSLLWALYSPFTALLIPVPLCLQAICNILVSPKSVCDRGPYHSRTGPM